MKNHASCVVPRTVFAATVLLALGLSAETLTWDKTKTGGAVWNDAENWLIGDEPAGRIPQTGDDVVFPNRAANAGKVYITESTPELASLTVNTGWNLVMSGWDTCLRATTVSIQGTSSYYAYAATVSCAGGFGDNEMSNRVWIVAKDLTVTSAGLINANGGGYLEANGPCWKIATGTKKNSNCSGVYGGDLDVPYFNDSLTQPHPYGSIRWPLDPGSGAWGNGGLATKRSGGGAVLIELTGDLVLNGTISADGIEPWAYCGGGSGGSVAIRCRTISGSGRISADAKDYNTNTQVIYGGGGGRIAVEYDPTAQASVPCGVRFTAHGGATRMGLSEGGRYHYVGGCGSIWFPDLQLTTRSNLNLGGVLYTGDSPTPVTSLSFDGPLALNSCRLEFLADDVVVTVKGNCGLTGTVTRAHGIAFRGRNAKLTVGGNLEMKGASVRAKDGLDLQVAGNVIQPEGTLNGTASDLWIGAGPTNGVAQAFGATVTIGGAWTMGNGCAYAPVCQPTNGAVVYAKAQSVQFASSAFVSASSAGYWYAWRKGSTGVYAGGDHGGLGGANTAADKAKGTVYGNKRMPLTPGSGAGDLYWSFDKYGGGVVAIETVGNMTIDCPVSANGAAGQIYAGATAGGSIFLKCGGHLSGDPGVTLSANGGAADKVSLTTSTHGSGGGGGRIAVWYQTKDESVDGWTLSVEGGKCEYAGEGTPSQWGDAGTTYWRQWNKGLLMMLR